MSKLGADLHTPICFGNGLDETTYAQLGAVVGPPPAWARLKAQKLGDLLAAHAGRRWFHWELEFPEVFAGARRGFDVVVGNPPYVDVSSGPYVPRHYECASPRNLYAYMLERGGGDRWPVYLLKARVYRELSRPEATRRAQGPDRTQLEQMILEYVEGYGQISRREASALCRLTDRQAGYLLQNLMEHGERGSNCL